MVPPCTSMMARQMILPASLRYLTEVANAVVATKAAGVDVKVINESLDDVRWIVGINVWGVLNGCHAGIGSPRDYGRPGSR